MNNNSDIPQELFEAIERYVNGTMDAKELKDFNDYLKIDAEFKAQVEDIKTMLLGTETKSLKPQLGNFHENIPELKKQQSSSKKNPFLNYSKIAIAAAIVIAVGSIWFFSNIPNRSLYNKYFKPAPGLPTTMSSADNFDFYDAMVNYKHGDYKTAIDKWQILSENKPENDTINYFLGVAHLANKNIIEAIPFLERSVEAEDNSVFLNDAYFYLGLAYLKEGNLELAKKHLSLSNTDKGKTVLLELTD